MKILHLMRHATAAPDWPSSDDFNRPLSEVGKREAAFIGHRLKESGQSPDRVCCSGARRAQETWGHLGFQLPPTAVGSFDRLYSASPASLLNFIRQQDSQSGDHLKELMVIAHNPTIEAMIAGLASPDSSLDALKRAGQGIFPASLSTFQFDVKDWSQIVPRGGRLTDFISPRELTGD